MTVGIRMTPEMRDKFKEIADEEMRTLSNLILKILTEYLQERDINWRNEKNEEAKK